MTGPAPRLSLAEHMTVARFDKAPPAPESFDATAAVRRVLALAEDMEAQSQDPLQARVVAMTVVAAIRRAVEGQR